MANPKLVLDYEALRYLQGLVRQNQSPRSVEDTKELAALFANLRRTHATLLRAGGVPLNIVARNMRHSTSRMVERVYGRLTAEQTGEVMAKALPAPQDVPGANAAALAQPVEHRLVMPEVTGSNPVGGRAPGLSLWHTLRFRRAAWFYLMKKAG